MNKTAQRDILPTRRMLKAQSRIREVTPEFFSVADGARHVGLSATWLKGVIKSGAVAVYKPNRRTLVRRSELVEYMSRFRN